MPEFLIAARPLETFTRPERILIGVRSSETARRLAELMRQVAPAAPIISLSPVEAELAKLCSNAMLAAKVTMANELAEICRRFGVAWSPVQTAIGLDPRIGPDHLTVREERGFGGGCLPKDVEGLIAAADAAGYSSPILRAMIGFNKRIRAEAAARREGQPTMATAGFGDGR